MSHLWIRDDGGEWVVFPLDRDAFDLGTYPPKPTGSLKGGGLSRTVLFQNRQSDSPIWVLLAGPRSVVRINGFALQTGIHVVANRDEIRVGEMGTIFFSIESLARVEPFPASGKSLFCPRCKLEIANQTSSVKCPQCGIWHHQTDDLPCWTYSVTCALCPQPSKLSAGYQWTPEEI